MRKSECGLRPVGAIGAYAPEGRWKREHRAKGMVHGAEDGGQMTEDGGQMTEDGAQMTEDR
jgi:hypothetical protein